MCWSPTECGAHYTNALPPGLLLYAQTFIQLTLHFPPFLTHFTPIVENTEQISNSFTPSLADPSFPAQLFGNERKLCKNVYLALGKNSEPGNKIFHDNISPCKLSGGVNN